MRNNILLLFCLLVFHYGKCQNIFDFEHSLKFANYLYENKQFGYAAQEFDRLCFMQPSNDSLLLLKIRSVAKANQLNRFAFNLNHIQSSVTLSEEYVFLLLRSKHFEESLDFIRKNSSFNLKTKSNLLTYYFLLQADLPNAKKNFSDSELKPEKISSLFQTDNAPKQKSPALALALSTLIPGSGKIYTHHSRDGMTTFLLVAVNAWQAYDGFQKLGKRNLYPWLFTGLGGSFYLGNLYGSFHSAKEFNQQQHEQFCKKAQDAIFSDR